MIPADYSRALLTAARAGGARVVALPDGGAVIGGRRGHAVNIAIAADTRTANRPSEILTEVVGAEVLP